MPGEQCNCKNERQMLDHRHKFHGNSQCFPFQERTRMCFETSLNGIFIFVLDAYLAENSFPLPYEDPKTPMATKDCHLFCSFESKQFQTNHMVHGILINLSFENFDYPVSLCLIANARRHCRPAILHYFKCLRSV